MLTTVLDVLVCRLVTSYHLNKAVSKIVTDRAIRCVALLLPTVLGLLEPASLGVTMMHEHMHLDFNVAFIAPEGKHADKANCDFTLENSGWIRQNP